VVPGQSVGASANMTNGRDRDGKILKAGIFDDIWIQPAAGDAGGAGGAAYAVWHIRDRQERRVSGTGDAMRGSLLGPEFSPREIQRTIGKYEGARPLETWCYSSRLPLDSGNDALPHIPTQMADRWRIEIFLIWPTRNRCCRFSQRTNRRRCCARVNRRPLFRIRRQ